MVLDLLAGGLGAELGVLLRHHERDEVQRDFWEDVVLPPILPHRATAAVAGNQTETVPFP